MGLSYKRELNFYTVVPTLDTNAYGAGDVLFDRTLIPGVSRQGGTFFLESIVVLDKDDQAAAAMTIYFLKADVTLGTANAAISISDTNAEQIIGSVTIASGDWADTINSKVATKTGINLPLEPVDGTQGIYFAATTSGTPTQTASGLRFRFGISKN